MHPDVNFEELARSTNDFNDVQLKAVCVEAGMLVLRQDVRYGFLSLLFYFFMIFLSLLLNLPTLFPIFQVNHEDFNEGIIQVQAKKKASLNYYA